MNYFRKFLLETKGESACLFWLDVDYMLNLAENETSRISSLIRRIHATYLKDGAIFSLADHIRKQLLADFFYPESNDRQTQANNYPGKHSKQVEALARGQVLILESLRGYWSQKYKLYWEKSQLNPKKTVSFAVRNDSAIKKQRAIAFSLPHIASEKTNVPQKVQRQPHITLGTCKLPGITREYSNFSTKGSHLTDKNGRVGSANTQVLCSASSVDVTPRPISSVSGVSKDLEYFHLHPFLNASLRADFLSGNPLLTHFSKNHNTRALNYLHFWQSVEELFILDEMKRCYKTSKNVKKCPYIGYIEFFQTAKSLKELVRYFLKEGARYRIELPTGIREELVRMLPRGLGQSLLMAVQEYAAEVSSVNIALTLDRLHRPPPHECHYN